MLIEVLYPYCAGLDVHKKTVVACVCVPDADGTPHKTIRTFTTMTAGLLALSDWLTSVKITHVAMESTGEFWKPVFNVLEGSFSVLVVNAAHLKNVPGRKTDVKDAEWICALLRHGLLRGSFIPPQGQRDVRDLTRQRTNLVQDRATVVNRLQKVLEWANITLAAVATDVSGVSARAMLEAIVGGECDPATLAELARGRMRTKLAALAQALHGYVRDHHRFLIAQHLAHIDFLDEQISSFDEQVEQMLSEQAPPSEPHPAGSEPQEQQTEPVASRSEEGTPPAPTAAYTWEEAVAVWDDIPGIGRRVAEQLVAEIGTDMSRFPSAAHLASWARLAPGNRESAGKRLSGATGRGNRWLRQTLIQAAHGAVKVKASYLGAFYRRLVARRGVKKAIVAVAHKLLTIVYTLAHKRERYKDLGAAYLDQRRQDQLLNRMRQKIEALGYTVTLEPREPAVA